MFSLLETIAIIELVVEWSIVQILESDKLPYVCYVMH